MSFKQSTLAFLSKSIDLDGPHREGDLNRSFIAPASNKNCLTWKDCIAGESKRLEHTKKIYQLSDRDIYSFWEFFKSLIEIELKSSEKTTKMGPVEGLSNKTFSRFFFPEEPTNVFLSSILKLAFDDKNTAIIDNSQTIIRTESKTKTTVNDIQQDNETFHNIDKKLSSSKNLQRPKSNLIKHPNQCNGKRVAIVESRRKSEADATKQTDQLSRLQDEFTVMFDGFVHGICTFAVFSSIDDMCKFLFFVSDQDKMGFLEKANLEELMQKLHRKQAVPRSSLLNNPSFPLGRNSAMGQQLLELRKGGNFNSSGKHLWIALNSRTFTKDQIEFKELCNLCEQFPLLLYPLFDLKQRLHRAVMGEYWWQGKMKNLRSLKEESDRKLAEKLDQTITQLTIERDNKIRKMMGSMRYILDPKTRRNYEEKFAVPIVYVDQDGEIKIKSKVAELD